MAKLKPIFAALMTQKSSKQPLQEFSSIRQLNMDSLFQNRIASHLEVVALLSEDAALLARAQRAAELMLSTFQNGGKVLFCGNGGSAADAQHLAAELSGRFYKDREPLFAEALHVNGSYLTAVANDYNYEEVYARMVRAMGRKGDVLVALSTSGNSGNVLKAAQCARELGMSIIGMTGMGGGALAHHCDVLLNMPSNDTPRIQECHMLLGHILCEMLESSLFP
jgi:D-sedoheptulose 7-phosphate isomerase